MRKVLFPYHEVPRQQKFPSFPLQLRSPRPKNFTVGSLGNKPGAVDTYHRLIDELCKPDLSALDSLLELTLCQRVRKEIAVLRASGHSLRVVGPAASTTAKELQEAVVTGLLPFRNLNLPLSSYRCKVTPSEAAIHLSLLPKKKREYEAADADVVRFLDLKAINRVPNHEDHKHIPVLASFLQRLTVSIAVSDVGIVTKRKIVICDSAGKVVDGGSEDSEEFHVLRMEALLPPELTDRKTKLLSPWIERQFQELVMRYSIVDIDGVNGSYPMLNAALQKKGKQLE